MTSQFRIFSLNLKFELDSFVITKHKEITPKGGFIDRLFSYSSSSNQETNKVFVLNPFPHCQFLKNNKKNNVIYLMNENCLKKLEIDFTNNEVEPQVS